MLAIESEFNQKKDKLNTWSLGHRASVLFTCTNSIEIQFNTRMKKIKADLIVTDGKLLHLFTPVFVLTFQHEENY